MSQRHTISGDANLNPALAAQVASLRGGIRAQAETIPLPDRFAAEPHPDRPAMILKDHSTGRETIVSLCHYHGVRSALTDLFN